MKDREEFKMLQTRAICTIIAKNYLASARTMAESFLAFHPDLKCYVLIVDEFDDYINPADERFEIIRLTDLGIPNLRSLCFKYDVKELCTAVKAELLDYLIRRKSIDRLLYVDPDILITGSLDGIFEKLGVYDIVLTPHLDTDYPDDDLLPDDGHVLRAGIFNLGFIGINSSENSASFIDWWKPKLVKHCVVDLANGYFVDQKFVDLAPLFFQNIFVEKDVGYNAAYWNLHSRRLSRDHGAWLCNEGPLYFFHFSGYNPGSAAISIHVPSSLSRYRLSSRPDVRPLFAEYKKRLLKNGYQQSRKWPYTFGYFKTGEPIPDQLRLYYRNCPSTWQEPRDPFGSNALMRRARMVRGSRRPIVLTPAVQLEAILSSRAWHWVSLYGRFKNRCLVPVYEFLEDLFGRKRAPRQASKKDPINPLSSSRSAKPGIG